MPSPGSTSLIAFGAVLTAVSATAGAIVAGLGVLFEGYVFVRAGLD
jgi:hypothetical protein